MMSLLRRFFRLFRFLISRTFLVFLGLVALALFVWFAGPLFAFADWRPLAGETPRWAIIATIFSLFLLWQLVSLWRRKNVNGLVLDQLTKIRQTASARKRGGPGQDEVAELEGRFSAAASTLKNLKLPGSDGWGRLSGRYMYELPWYVIIGAPGSGKTTALINSGLNFPLADQFGKTALRGVGGTRNCDWWFTDEAVVVDTAGRYATQDSNADTDKAEWSGFLALLKKYRPRQPINGVILTLSVPDLLSFTTEQRQAHFTSLRTRLVELQEAFQIELPVYLWVTKADLLAGFNEFFDAYSKEQRNQVWGFTLALQHNDNRKVVEALDEEWRLLQERLYALQNAYLSREFEQRRRNEIYGLPQQFAGLQDIIRQAAQFIFSESRIAAKPLLRGVYFSSGTQEGTPFDRILTTLRRNFGPAKNSPQPALKTEGKSFFLHDLLVNLIFKESHLAGRNVRWERRTKRVTYAGYAASLLLLAGAIGAWALSYDNNTDYLSAVERDASKLSEGVSAYSASDGDLASMLSLLNGTRALGDTGDFTRTDPPLPYRYGLYQGNKVGTAADLAYNRLLTDGLLPIVAKRLEAQLRTPPVDSLEYLYEALKAYLMLHDSERYDPVALKRWVSADIRRYLLPDADKETLDELDTHLSALFTKDRVVAAPLPKNEALVAAVRAKLSTLSTSQRIYSRLRGRLDRVDLPDFNLIDVAGPQAANVFTRRSHLPLNRGVSGLFTYQGYWDVFDKEVGKVATEMGDDEGWVLGLPAKSAKTQFDDAAQSKLVREVRMLFLRDYAEVWDQYLNDVQLIQSDSLQTSIQRLRVLSAPDSPLPLFLRGVVKETTLLRENRSGNEQTVIDRARQRLKNTRDDIERVVGPVTAGNLKPDRKLDRIVDDRFEALRRLVGAPGSQGTMPIDATLKLLDEYYGMLVATDAAIKSGGTPPPPDTAIRVRAEAARMPQPVRGMMDRIAATSSAQASGLVRSAIGANLNATVGDFCRKAVAGRYPLNRASPNDVVPDDFARLFAPGGLMDDFFSKNLAPIVDTSNWTFKKNIDGSWAGGSNALNAFHQASVIRDVFFRDGSRTPKLRLEIKTVEMDPSISNMSLDVDGTVVRYSHGPQMSQTVTWPGPRAHNQVLLQISAPDVGQAGIKTDGAWALHRLFDKLNVSSGSSPEKFLAAATVGGKKIVFEVSTNSVQNPFRLRQLEEFNCPRQF